MPTPTFDFAAFVPLQLRAVLEAGRAARLNKMRAILVGGASRGCRAARAAQALTVPVYHTYGMTETASHVALRRLNGPDATDYYRVLPGICSRAGRAGLPDRCAATLPTTSSSSPTTWWTCCRRSTALLAGAGRFCH